MNNMMDLTKNPRSCIKIAPLMKGLGILVAVVGMLGILLGVYQLVFASIPLGERRLTISLFLDHIGLFLMGCFLFPVSSVRNNTKISKNQLVSF